MAFLPDDQRATWLDRHAAWMDAEIRDSILRLGPHWYSSRSLGDHLEVDNDDRERLKVWTVEAYDITKEQREVINREKNRQSHERGRRKAGAKPREQSLERMQPWKLLGMSRAKFYRLPKESRDALVADLARNSGETDSSRPSLVERHTDETVSGVENGTETLPPAPSQPDSLDRTIWGVNVSGAEQEPMVPSEQDSSSIAIQKHSVYAEQAPIALREPHPGRSSDGKVTSLADYLAERKALALVRSKPATAHTEPLPLAV
jgi:hypothetical protein